MSNKDTLVTGKFQGSLAALGNRGQRATKFFIIGVSEARNAESGLDTL